jgi:hypothetical protein
MHVHVLNSPPDDYKSVTQLQIDLCACVCMSNDILVFAPTS